ncbi:hypothetical protein [Minwuia thermotolerans]|uniref:Uncharacterized protein n=1 Tax=Minwuia thermotolerans TaxID=2056226 RepID=A0A2M9G2M3_9PROT|nr:hypothetical protein [Minwuia thermotolerans]PJK29963.1 hypothetical protein CVT23_09355 [Minwuia thermotolerans]
MMAGFAETVGGISLLVIVVTWIAGAFAVAWAASQRGRDGTNWFGISLLLSPYFTVMLLIAAGDTEYQRQETADRMAKSVGRAAAAANSDGARRDRSRPRPTSPGSSRDDADDPAARFLRMGEKEPRL